MTHAAETPARVSAGRPAATRTLKLTLAYDGSRFVGWQRQAAGESIQGLLEAVLERIEGNPVTVHGAGRTDAGVHALGQVASVSVTSPHDVAALARAMNAELPEDIRVVEAAEASSEFHARFSARAKTYRYRIRNTPTADPFDRAYVWHLPEPLDVDAMRQAAAMFIGTHDFAAFQSTGGAVSSTVRTMHSSELVNTGGVLTYEVEGDGFLRHMVRAMVGTLVDVGRGRRAAGTIAEVMAGGRRADAGMTAPARGLFLVRVEYDA